MLKESVAFVLFCTVLYLYMCIVHQIKVSNDVDVFHVAAVTKMQLEELADLRQPMVIEMPIAGDEVDLVRGCSHDRLLSMYPTFDLSVRNVAETCHAHAEELYVTLPFAACSHLLANDKAGEYISESNAAFLEDTATDRFIRERDMFLRPVCVSNLAYDVLIGSAGSHTPLRFHMNYRQYLSVAQGSVSVKLVAPKYSRYLGCFRDYVNGENRCTINPWDSNADLSRVKVLDLELLPGKLLYVPCYWFASVRFNLPHTTVVSLSYKTYMTCLAILPHVLMSLLQSQNVSRRVASLPPPMQTANDPSPEIGVEEVKKDPPISTVHTPTPPNPVPDDLRQSPIPFS